MTTELSSDWRHTLCTCMSPYLCSVSLFSVPTVQPVFLWACLRCGYCHLQSAFWRCAASLSSPFLHHSLDCNPWEGYPLLTGILTWCQQLPAHEHGLDPFRDFVSQKGRLSAVMSNSGTNVPLVQMRIMFSGILASTLRPGHTITVGLHIGVHFLAAYITISLVSFSAASPQKHAFYPPLMSRSDQQRIVENVCNHNLRAET